MKVGLVLGAGGVVGASWLIGALEAVEAETGWRGSDAEFIIGTSAGSVVGSLCAAGLSGEDLHAHLTGASLDGLEQVDAISGGAPEPERASQYRPAWALPSIGPGSWRMAASTLVHARRHPASAVLGAWLPRGFIRTDPIRELVEQLVPGDWPEHPNYWAVACDYASGRRVCFGRADAPVATVGEAVAASCAIPGFYRPVEIDGRRYVDGGVCSPSNLDLLTGLDLDLVLCLNPTSSRARVNSLHPAERIAGAVRGVSGRRLGHEARKLRDEGTEVLLLQPGRNDLRVMGRNLMARDRRSEVIDQALSSTAAELRRLRGRDVRLPGVRPRRARPSAPTRASGDSGAGTSRAA